MNHFTAFAFTPAGLGDAALAVAASRAGAVGVYNAELDIDGACALSALGELRSLGRGPYGLKVDAIDAGLAAALAQHAGEQGLAWLFVDVALLSSHAELLAQLRAAGSRIVVEVSSASPLPAGIAADAIVVKGNEAPGFVGEDSSFILLQKWLRQSALPLIIRGGVTPAVAAACHAVGVAGCVLDSQLLMMDEVRLPEALRAVIGNLSGSETVAVGHGEEGEYYRLLVRPNLAAARQFVAEGEGKRLPELRRLVHGRVDWREPAKGLLPVGHEVVFAAAWRKRYATVRGVVAAIEQAVAGYPALARSQGTIVEGSGLASALGTRYPLVQGPMTRVSDTAEFALAVAEGGALPMVAFAMLKGTPLQALLERTAALLGDKPWGIGLLGFAPQSLLDEQLAIAARFKPRYAIIAGGRPDQAVQLEAAGVPTFLHVPSANLIPGFLQEGARRFIFEGRECGGHIGPLSSFVLWSSMIDKLLLELAPAGKVDAGSVELIFAGGIHDALSSAMLQVMVAPLAALGAKVGALMGTAYLFTREIVDSGAIVPQFQKEVLACERTVNLESGPGHASRCAYTPFAADFFRQRIEMRAQGVPADESRRVLDDLILGRLRIASKGSRRDGLNAELQQLDEATQRSEGMYMLGQVATLRDRVVSIAELHRDVSEGARALIDAGIAPPPRPRETPAPADVAIIGVGCVLPMAGDARRFWDNILAKVDAITEIPSHRWDWRLYYSEDRKAKDKIYSKWGGFLDDLAFDPTQYGMPPKSIESVDPMQMMGLEVARRTLVDAGYGTREFDRERASVIIGASGGTGDFGLQYGLRSELPRFSGELAEDVAARLPEWTEDSFAGILPNVVAGRIANRMNFGGINVTVDAACASSLAAVHMGVTELVAGRSDFVLAGGVDTVQGPFGYLCFSKTQALSPRGRCATFDADGDGIVISEGIAMIALKRLADAERDGDRIYAVIKGVGASSDGNAKGLTAPLPAGQLRAMRRAYSMAGFGPATVGLFEAHGTGTVAGDTAELESTTRLMQEEGARPRQAVIGSVKTNIGHTKASAGVAGLVKAVLSLHHRVLPPHRNVTRPNSVLADPLSPLYLLDEAMPWIARGELPRRAAASAFGFGGTNFHVVLEEYAAEYRDWLRPGAGDVWPAELLVWSDTDPAALAARLTALHDQLEKLPAPATLALRDLAASLAKRWRTRGHKLAIVARGHEDLLGKLAAAASFLRGESRQLPPGVFHGAATAPAGKVAVLFPGQGSQYAGMLREASLRFDVVAQTIAQADAILHAPLVQRYGESTALSQFIFPRGAYDDASRAAARDRLTSTDIAQPALGAVETGLFRLMQNLGLRPDMLAGHSYGEFVALHCAGAIDFAALMAISAARGRFIVDAAKAQGAELGTMAAVSAPRKVVEDAIADIDGVIIANHNAPLQCIVSGGREAVKAASEKLLNAGVEVNAIPVAAAFHSNLVTPAKQALSELIDATPWQAAAIPVYSNTTARPHAVDVGRVKRQMAEHLVRPVEWVAEIEAMHADGARVFVEIGPKMVLSRLVSRILDGKPHASIALDDGSGLPGLLAGLGQLLCAGVELDLASLFTRRDCRIGDPEAPAALARVETIAKHAWMLNGSGARRASEPVRQVGVTLEQAQQQQRARMAPALDSAPGAAPGAAGPAPQAPPAAPIAAPISAPNQSWRKGSPVDERRTAPGAADASVMSEYFATMRQFLETQERVMSAFLGDASPARPAIRTVRPPPTMLPRLAEAPPLVAVSPVVPAPAVVPVVAAASAPPAAAVVKPMAAPKAAPAPAPTTAPTPQAKASEASAASKSGSEELTRAQLLDRLLAIVEEKTGYPRDMVGLDQNLEADLGIDSIKRIEVVGAMLQSLPAGHREALTDSRSKLNTQATLNGMLDLIAQAKVGGAVAVPFELAGVGSRVDDAVSLLPRLVMRPEAESLADGARRYLNPGLFVLTRDRLGVAEVLASLLAQRGRCCVVLEPEVLASEQALVERCRSLAQGPLAGVVHLAPIGTPPLSSADAAPAWRQAPEAALQLHEKSLYLMLRELDNRLPAAAHVVAASDLGGLFGRAGSASSELRLVGGGAGTLKSYAEERPGLRVKAVDVDPAQGAAAIAAELLAEIELDGGRIEVGYPQGRRSVFRTVAEPARIDSARQAAMQGIVVLATGGARGITAEVLNELAGDGNVLILTGRSQLDAAESAETALMRDAAELRRHFVAQVQAGVLKATPGEIGRRVQRIVDQREMRANMADFRAAGARVEYHAVDVTDDAAIGALVEGIVARHGRLDGIVHGAGVIEDKRLVDKTPESWSRVVDTKVMGLLALARHVDPSMLKFFVVFSSVAGRYGNSGQSDYATANELMNRLCTSLQARWGDRVAVSALCWGPWAATRHGAGMVTAETEAKFAEKGVRLVTPAVGRRLFRDELACAVGTPVEVICGEGPWEARELEAGVLRMAPPPAPSQAPPQTSGPELGALVGHGPARSLPTGERIVPVLLDPARHLYLQEHSFDGKMVLPAAAALELMAEAVQALWPGWTVVEVREHKLLKGVELMAARELRVFISPPPYGSSEGFDVTALLQSELPGGAVMPHYRCTVRLEQALPAATPVEPRLHDDKRVTATAAYGEWLAHGPRLQVIERIDGLSPLGSSSLVRTSSPAQWMAAVSVASTGWLFDPALLDAAAQMAWVWSRAYRDETALPVRFGRVVRHRAALPGRLQMLYERTESPEPTIVRGNFVFVDEGGDVVLAIEELDSVASAALNRLGGKARAAEDAAA